MNNYKISSLSFAFIVICLINSTLLGIVFPYLIKETKTSFFFSLLLSFIIGFIFIYLFLKMFNLMPEKNLIEKVESVFPKSISIFINLIITILVFLLVIIVFWRFSTFVASEYLTETPTFIISLLLASPIFFAMFKDFDIAARCATIIIITIVFLFIFSRLTLLFEIDFENYKPILNSAVSHIGKGSLVTSILQIVPLFLTLIIPKSNITDSKNITKAVVIAYISSFFILASVITTIIGVLGVNISSLYAFPSYVVLKNISILNFIKNIENFSVIFWVMFMSFTCSFSLFFIKTSIKSMFKITKMKTLNVIMIIIFILFMIVIYFLISLESFINKYKNIYVFIPLAVYSLLFMIMAISMACLGIKKKRLKI